MPSTPTERVTLLSRRTLVQVNMGSESVPDWQTIKGIDELKLIDELRTEADEGYDDDGAYRETVTGYQWRLEVKFPFSAGIDGITFNPVHAWLRQKYLLRSALTGEIHVRWYDVDGRDDAFEGRAFVKAWNPEGGNSGAKDMISVVLQGQGQKGEMTNPAANPVPAVLALDAASGPAAGGDPVIIVGSNFAGATDVSFGAAPADFKVVDSTRIAAVSPGGAPGTVEVTVTTSEGVSATAGTGNEYTYV